MLDLKLIRKNPKKIEAKLRTKDPSLRVKPILEIDDQIRLLKQEVEQLKNQKNQNARQIGEKKLQGEDVKELIDQVGGLGKKVQEIDHQIGGLEKGLNEQLACLPNLPMEEVKSSLDPKENVCVKQFGTKPSFPFKPKNHLELNETLALFDFKRGVKLGGANWPCYRGLGARLEWALIQLMLGTHLANGFEMWIPPLACRSDIMHGSAHLPKFKEQLYKIETEEEQDLYLIPTAEAALNGLHYDEIIDEEVLPLRYTAFTPCFRREAGAAGSQERGLIRTHQFNKVELFCITRPQESEKIYQEMVSSAEKILKALNIHYRTMMLVTGDMSFASAKTIDLEVWLPGQGRYYEVSSISNCTDFQARRSKIRFKKGGEKPSLCHTLNGSGLATSRLMVALLENNQKEDGSVAIPTPLQGYVGGIETLLPYKNSTCPL